MNHEHETVKDYGYRCMYFFLNDTLNYISPLIKKGQVQLRVSSSSSS
jgi:hypothetical protein